MSTVPDIEVRTTQLLIEHFGYKPISVIDDIINAINEIMYKCTEQLEQIFVDQKLQLDKERASKKLNDMEDDIIVDDVVEEKIYTIEDIRIGTATLESLLEHNINKNFDKFEVYALRNVFTLPENLIEEGYIRLRHHKLLNIDDENDGNQTVSQIESNINNKIERITQEIEYQRELQKVLTQSLIKFKKILALSKIIRRKLEMFMKNEQIVSNVMPIKDTILYLAKQTRETCQRMLLQKDELKDEELIAKYGVDIGNNMGKNIDKIIEQIRSVDGTVDIDSEGYQSVLELLK
mgnify:FL=1